MEKNRIPHLFLLGGEIALTEIPSTVWASKRRSFGDIASPVDIPSILYKDASIRNIQPTSLHSSDDTPVFHSSHPLQRPLSDRTPSNPSLHAFPPLLNPFPLRMAKILSQCRSTILPGGSR